MRFSSRISPKISFKFLADTESIMSPLLFSAALRPDFIPPPPPPLTKTTDFIYSFHTALCPDGVFVIQCGPEPPDVCSPSVSMWWPGPWAVGGR